MAKLQQEVVEAMVEDRGLKMTPQRRAIVKFLVGATHHPTADDVLNAVNEEDPMTSRATVYNTLNWLKGEGMIREVFECGVVRFDPNTSNHHHFICRKCGKVEDVEGDLIRVDPLPDNQLVENFEVTLRGICAGCLHT